MPNSKPQVTRGTGPNQLPQGGAKQVNDSMQQMDALQANAPIPYSEPAPAEPPGMQGQLTGMDNMLFGGTDRPNEPISAGAPFGAGPSFVKYGAESQQDFMARVAEQVAGSPSSSPTTKAFMTRVLRGQ